MAQPATPSFRILRKIPPGIRVIVLDEGEGSVLQLFNPHRDPRIGELFGLGLRRRRTPPTRDVWLASPAQKQGQVRLADRADDVSGRLGPRITPKADLRNSRWAGNLTPIVYRVGPYFRTHIHSSHRQRLRLEETAPTAASLRPSKWQRVRALPSNLTTGSSQRCPAICPTRGTK